MKKKMQCLLPVLLLLAAVLGGCQGSKPVSGAGGFGTLTKSQWAGLLGERFGYNVCESDSDFYSDVKEGSAYYDEIQACAGWGIFPETDSFGPDDKVTWRYAMETCVRAVGIDKLNQSDAGMTVTEDNLVDFFASRIASVDNVELDEGLSEQEAKMMLEYTWQYASGLALEEKMECVYQDNVKEASAESVVLKGDGVTALARDGSTYAAGDIIYVEPSETEGAYAIRVTAVNGNELTYVQAEMEEVYQELRVTGTFEADVIHVEPAEGVNVSRAVPSGPALVSTAGRPDFVPRVSRLGGVSFQDVSWQMAPAKVTAGNGGVVFDADLGNGVTVNVAITGIRATADVDYAVFSGLKKADITLSFQDKATAKYEKEHVSRQIPLGTIEVPLGATPLAAKISLTANLGFDGKVTLTYSSTVVASVKYSKGSGFASSVTNNNPQCDFHADATVTVEPCVKVDLCCLGRSLANVKVTSGVVAVAKLDVDLLGNNPACTDIYLYVPLRWAVNEDGCLMTTISGKFQTARTVWDSESSPVNQRFHWEDGSLVEACTRGKQKVETAAVNDEGLPYDEYKLFDFEEIVFGTIRTASQTLYLSKGETMAVGILAVPDGYSVEELRYSTADSSVCTAAGGMVTAGSFGSTTLQISTGDGKFSVFLTVVVEAEYHDTSGFESL